MVCFDTVCCDGYTVTSLIQIQPVWRQHCECEDPEALSFSSPLCAALVDLLDPPHLQVLHSVVQLTKVGCNFFFLFFLFLCWSVLHSSSCVGYSLSLQHTAGCTSCMIWDKPDFCLVCDVGCGTSSLWSGFRICCLSPFLDSTYTVSCCICCCRCWLKGQVWSSRVDQKVPRVL